MQTLLLDFYNRDLPSYIRYIIFFKLQLRICTISFKGYFIVFKIYVTGIWKIDVKTYLNLISIIITFKFPIAGSGQVSITFFTGFPTIIRAILEIFRADIGFMQGLGFEIRRFRCFVFLHSDSGVCTMHCFVRVLIWRLI